MERVDVRQNTLPVEHETLSSAVRMTADNRKITYRLHVLQQPLRARACGQGAKSSADRRPVDPPPIVELRIYDGDTDVTFSMQANYFLFATLEQARPMAHGRMTGDKTTPPVLTGTPVAGMVYLDRPTPAGYFIFPDLSVRHEGKYRLSFSLYEDLKNCKDDDKQIDGAEPSTPGESHVTHRLEVRSEPFMVYSAKKFPGLTESTSLSRLVAEQGCRVRIRRDVRMRRRDTKPNGKEWDDYEEETAHARATLSATPDPNAYASLPTPHGYADAIPRPRSASNTSHHSLASNISRKQSLQDFGSSYNHHYPTTNSHVAQGAFNPAPPYGTHATPHYQPSFGQQQTSMQPPPPHYQPHSYAALSPAPPSSTQSAYYSYAAPQAPQAQYAPPPPSYEHAPQPLHMADYPSQMQPDHRRSFAPPGTPMSSTSQLYPSPGYTSLPKSSYQQSSVARPAPLEPRTNGVATPLSGRPNFELPPLNTTVTPSSNNTRIETASPVSAVQSNTYSNAFQPQAESHKRNYGSVFNDKYQDQPMRQGARPGPVYRSTSDAVGATGLASAAATTDEDDTGHGEFNPESIGMKYRRADGRQILRSLPTQT